MFAAGPGARLGAQEADATRSEKAAKNEKKVQTERADSGEGAGGGLVIPWDGGELKGSVQIIKRFYRLKKSGQWGADRLPKLCEQAIAKGDPKLRMYATWYQALVAGHEGKTDEAVAKLKEAVELDRKSVV